MSEEEKPLEEDEFIQEGVEKYPFPFWIWLFVVLTTVFVFWIFGHSLSSSNMKKSSKEPFYQVTNREFFLFASYNPEVQLRYPQLKGELEGNPPVAETWVEASPEDLFLFHTWDHFLRDQYLIASPISAAEFLLFLEAVPIWKPEFWPNVREEYRLLVAALPQMGQVSLSSLSEKRFPKIVRLAFQGWKNTFLQREEVQDLQPSYAMMRAFVAAFPHYERSYWKNIVDTGEKQYLIFLEEGEDDAIMGDDQLTGFLKQAFFDAVQSNPGL